MPAPLRRLWLLAALLMPLAVQAATVAVELQGVSGALRDNVLALLAIAQPEDAAALTAPRVRRLDAEAPAQIRRALEPFGYYRAQVHSTLERTAGGWRARYVIDPGPPLPVGRVTVTLQGPGRDDPVLAALVDKFPLRTGDTLDQSRYTDAKQGLQRAALDQGYLDARFTAHRIDVDLKTYRAGIDLVLATGIRYRFGAVHFSPAGLRESLLRRYLPFQPGDPYATVKLLELQQALEDSDYFSRVDVVPGSRQAGSDTIPIDVELTPRKRQKYTLGLGYGTDTGARASVGWENRRINDRGHRLRSDLKVSQVRQELSADYIIPIRNPRTDRVDFTAAMSHEDTADQFSRTRLLGVSRTVAAGAWRRTLSLNFQNEQFRAGGTYGTSTLLIPGASWSRVRADNRVYATRGSRISLDLRGAAKAAISDTNFVQARLQAKVIRPLVGGRLILRGEVGATAVSSFRNLPTSLRFFAGGDQSVRGYGYNTLGPLDDTGQVAGGRDLLVGSVEYDHPIVGKWGAAIFYDTGNAMDAFRGPLKRGAGIGLRWRSPVGMVRVDLAAAVSEPGHPLRLHISLGPDL